MKPEHVKKALGEMVGLADSTMDGKLKALAPKPAVEMEEGESVEENDDLTPEELAKVRELLAGMEG